MITVSIKVSFDKLSRPLPQVLKSVYNDSQLQAISAAIGPFDSKKDFQLSLIQGPPGIGKTRVIVAIVSSLLSFPQVGTKRSSNGDKDSLTLLQSNLEKLVDTIKCYEAKRASLRDGDSDSNCLLEGDTDRADNAKEMSDVEVETKLRILYEKKKLIYMDLIAAQAREEKANEETKALRHKLRKAILKEAEIVVTTLSACGGDLYGVCATSVSGQRFSISSEGVLFYAVVIDEAAQALELVSLIPLQLLKSKGTRYVMVGDPKQLPAKVLSNIGNKFYFQCSMFERL